MLLVVSPEMSHGCCLSQPQARSDLSLNGFSSALSRSVGSTYAHLRITPNDSFEPLAMAHLKAPLLEKIQIASATRE
jgi:hypothetical protein